MPRISNWQRREQANGGWVGMTGRITRRELLQNPDLYVDGAEWIVYGRETGVPIGYGTLKQPADNGGAVDLSADGPALIADRELDRLLYMKRGSYREWAGDDTEDKRHARAPTMGPTIVPDGAGNIDVGMHHWRVSFVTADGETRPGPRADYEVTGSAEQVELIDIPTGPRFVTGRVIYRTEAGGSDYKLLTAIGDNTTTSYTDNTADSGLGAAAPEEFSAPEIDASTGDGALVFVVDRGATVFDGQFAALSFTAEPEEISRVDFALEKSRDATQYRVRLSSADDDEDPFASEDSWTMGDDAPGAETVRLDDQNAQAVRFALERIGDTVDAEHFRVKVTDLDIYGRATDPDFTTSDIARDVGVELGLDVSRVQESGAPALPADFRGGTYGQVLDLMALLSGDADTPWRWLIYRVGRSLVLDFGPFRTRRFIFDHRWGVPRLLPLPLFNHATVIWRRADGSFAQAEAFADPDPLAGSARPGRRSAPPVVLDHPGGRDKAERLVARLAAYYSRQRVAGTLEFSRLRNERGVAVSHELVHGGDEIFVPNLGLWVQVDSLEGDTDVTQTTHPEKLPVLERFEARRELRRASSD